MRLVVECLGLWKDSWNASWSQPGRLSTTPKDEIRFVLEVSSKSRTLSPLVGVDTSWVEKLSQTSWHRVSVTGDLTVGVTQSTPGALKSPHTMTRWDAEAAESAEYMDCSESTADEGADNKLLHWSCLEKYAILSKASHNYCPLSLYDV